jgi:hypothetical protein
VTSLVSYFLYRVVAIPGGLPIAYTVEQRSRLIRPSLDKTLRPTQRPRCPAPASAHPVPNAALIVRQQERSNGMRPSADGSLEARRRTQMLTVDYGSCCKRLLSTLLPGGNCQVHRVKTILQRERRDRWGGPARSSPKPCLFAERTEALARSMSHLGQSRSRGCITETLGSTTSVVSTQ